MKPEETDFNRSGSNRLLIKEAAFEKIYTVTHKKIESYQGSGKFINKGISCLKAISITLMISGPFLLQFRPRLSYLPDVAVNQ